MPHALVYRTAILSKQFLKTSLQADSNSFVLFYPTKIGQMKLPTVSRSSKRNGNFQESNQPPQTQSKCSRPLEVVSLDLLLLAVVVRPTVLVTPFLLTPTPSYSRYSTVDVGNNGSTGNSSSSNGSDPPPPDPNPPSLPDGKSHA